MKTILLIIALSVAAFGLTACSTYDDGYRYGYSYDDDYPVVYNGGGVDIHQSRGGSIHQSHHRHGDRDRYAPGPVAQEPVVHSSGGGNISQSHY